MMGNAHNKTAQKGTRSGSLRRSLLLAFVLIIVLLSGVNVISLRLMYENRRSTEKLLETLFLSTNLSTEFGESHQLITNAINYQDRGLVEDFRRSIEGTVRHTRELDRAMLRFAESTGDMNTYYRFLEVQKAVLTYRDRSLVLSAQFISDAVKRVQLYDILYELKTLKNDTVELQSDLLYRQSLYIQGRYEEARQQIGRSIWAMTGVTIAVLALCILFSVAISRRVSVPIHLLVEKAGEIGSGEFGTLETPGGTNREIARLITSFNHMSRQLLQRQEIEQRLREEEVKNLQMENLLNRSEMQLLQSRINPHFLFNTLQMISTLTQIEEAPGTEKMINSLSSLLRYILKKGNQETTLGEELAIIEDYMHIQTARFGGRISYHLELEPELEAAPLPALSIQPFVENSIIHGLEPKKGKGALHISCIRSGEETITITISDDGAGMAQEKLEEVLDTERSLSRGEHLGVANTLRRFEIAYGKGHVAIESEEGKGTRVRLTIPLQESAPRKDDSGTAGESNRYSS